MREAFTTDASSAERTGTFPANRSQAGYYDSRTPPPRRTDHLTRREKAIFRELVDKRTNPQIARQMGISPETVKTHVSHILAKLGVRSRTELSLFLE